MKATKHFLLITFLLANFMAYSESNNRDVPYTEELYYFIDCFYNNEIPTLEKAQYLRSACIEKIPESFDEYQKYVHLARTDFYFGMAVMEEVDFDSIQNIKSPTDTSSSQKNLSESKKQKKAKAASYFDKAISYADKALKIRAGSDAYIIKAMAISSNCTVKDTGYVIMNGLDVGNFSKKAVSADPANATAHYYQYAQDLYAPSFFANYKRGLKKMHEFQSDINLNKEKFDSFFILTGLGYGYYMLKDNSNAVKWYKRALLIYPGNKFAIEMVNKLSQ